MILTQGMRIFCFLKRNLHAQTCANAWFIAARTMNAIGFVQDVFQGGQHFKVVIDPPSSPQRQQRVSRSAAGRNALCICNVRGIEPVGFLARGASEFTPNATRVTGPAQPMG